MTLARRHWASTVGAPLEFAVAADDWSRQRLHDIVVGAGFSIDSIRSTKFEERASLRVRAHRIRSLPDTVGPSMRVLVCGLNPSEFAADQGVGFARPGNRFWPAAVAAGLVTAPLDPAAALTVDRVGMTDLVKRATRRSSELTPDEYVAGFARVKRLVEWLQPQAIAFVGLEGWRAAVDRRAKPGWQPEPIGPTPVYLLPSTSGLNAHSSLASLTDHLREVADASCKPRPN